MEVYSTDSLHRKPYCFPEHKIKSNNHLNCRLLTDISNPTLKRKSNCNFDPCALNQAAKIVARNIRNRFSEKSYEYMFVNSKKTWMVDSDSPIEFMKKKSKENLQALRSSLKQLQPNEKEFLDVFLKTQFFVTHATNAKLENEQGVLSIFSNMKLKKRRISFKDSSAIDNSTIAADDFVFFSLEAGEVLQKKNSRFGNIFYRVNLKEILEKPAWMSLTEEFIPRTPDAKNLQVISEVSRSFLKEELEPKECRFFQNDILPGLALSIIYKARILPEAQKNELLSGNDPVKINNIINGLFRPEIKVPVHFITSSYRMEITINGEILDRNKLNCLDYACEMLAKSSDNKDIDNIIKNAPIEIISKKEFMIIAVSKNREALSCASDELKADREIVLAAVQQSGYALQYASDELKADREIVLAAVQQSGYALQYASDELKADREIVLAAVQQSGNSLRYASDGLKADREIVLAAVQQSGNSLRYASDELKADREIVLAAVQKFGGALQYASDELKADREIVLPAVQQSGDALQYASDELKADREIALPAVQQSGDALQYASDELKADREIALAAVQQSGYALQYASDELKADWEIVLAAVQKSYSTFQYASDDLKADGEFVLKVVQKSYSTFQYASDDLKADGEFVLKVVQKSGDALKYASDELKANREIVLAAVQQSGYALQYASDELKADREIVLAAVQQSGDALQYASDELKADREIVLAAVQQSGDALQYASDELKSDKEIALMAVSTCPQSLCHVSRDLKIKHSKDFLDVL